MVPGVVPTGAVPGVSTPPDGVMGVPGWPGTPAPGVATLLPGAPGTPAAPGVPGTVWAKAVLLRPRPSRAVKSNLEDFIIDRQNRKRKVLGRLLGLAMRRVLRVAAYLDDFSGRYHAIRCRLTASLLNLFYSFTTFCTKNQVFSPVIPFSGPKPAGAARSELHRWGRLANTTNTFIANNLKYYTCYIFTLFSPTSRAPASCGCPSAQLISGGT